MITTLLPTYNEPAFSFQTTLDDVSVFFDVVWNNRTEHYHLTLTLEDGTLLLDGQKLIVGCPINTSAMFANNLRGAFNLVPIDNNIEDNATARENWVDNFMFSYTS